MQKFCNNPGNYNKSENINYIEDTVNNFSICVQSHDEEVALVYGLEHLPGKPSKVAIKNKFELFYQSLLKSVLHIPKEYICAIKMKWSNTYVKYIAVFSTVLY